MYMYNVMYNVMYTCSTTQWSQNTALHYASERGHRETVQLLLEKGADPNVQDSVSVLLMSRRDPVCLKSSLHTACHDILYTCT